MTHHVIDLIYSPFQTMHYVELRLHSGTERGYFFKTVPGLLKELLK
jgi:hypothetical protein